MSSSPDQNLLPDPSQNAPPQSRWKLVGFKLLMALLVCVVTGGVGCLAGIYSLRKPDSWVCLPQRSTVWPQMSGLKRKLDQFKEKHGSFPLTLEKMTSEWTGPDEKPLEDHWIARSIQDGWENPMFYSSDGKTWELISYGADNKPGGIGLDADIRATDADEPNFESAFSKSATPTIRQVIQSQHFGSTFMFSGLVVLVFLAQFFSPKHRMQNRSEIILQAIGLTIVSSIVVFGLVSFTSIASGH